MAMENEMLEIVKSIKNDILELKFEVNEQFKQVNEQFKQVNERLDEHTQILRALEHSAEINRAEHDKMNNTMAHMQGDIEAIKKDLSRVEEATAYNWADIARLKAVK
jgi:uncharacterized coiled-coil DUF342 family protein